jgi:hypothetical protein
MQATTDVRRSRGAAPKQVQPVRRYENGDYGSSSHVNTGLLFKSGRADHEYLSADVTQFNALQVLQRDSYHGSFSDDEYPHPEDLIDEYGYSIPTHSRYRNEEQDHSIRLANKWNPEIHGYENRQSHQKHEIPREDYKSYDISYYKNRNRDNQHQIPRGRQLLVDEKDLLDRNARAWEEAWGNLEEHDTSTPSEASYRDRSAAGRRMHCMYDLEPTPTQPFPRARSAGDRLQQRSPEREQGHRASRPRPLRVDPPQPAPSHVPAEPSKSTRSQVALLAAPRPSRTANVTARATLSRSQERPGVAANDQELLRKAFAASVIERRGTARSWREQRGAWP